MATKSAGNLALSDKENTDAHEGGKKGSLESVLKKLLKTGQEKGFLTYDAVNKALPAESFSSEQIDDAMAALSDLGIQLVEIEASAGEEEESSGAKSEDDEEYESGGNISADDTGRTDDPVRMYLREMGAVELLSREGEIAIAKRIEAGRSLMIGGICESPLAIESLIAWYESLQNGEILLREVIDLDATYKNDVLEEAAAAAEEESEEEIDEIDENADGEENDDDENDGDDASSNHDDEANVSLAAMEEEVAPKVYEIFGSIQKTYKKMQKAQVPLTKNITSSKKKWLSI